VADSHKAEVVAPCELDEGNLPRSPDDVPLGRSERQARSPARPELKSDLVGENGQRHSNESLDAKVPICALRYGEHYSRPLLKDLPPQGGIL
jgi:hypothetical protein